MSDVALFLLFFSLFVSLVNSVWPKLQDVWWISYAKTSPPSLDNTQCNGHSAIPFPSLHLSSPPFPPLRSATPSTDGATQSHLCDRTHPVFIIIFANEVFCAWSTDHLFTEGKTKKQTKKKTTHIATDSYAPYRNRRFLILSLFPGNSESPRRSNRKSCSHH